MLRRIARDPTAADAIIGALPSAPSNSARLSLLALLGKGSADRAKVQPTLLQALAEDEMSDVPRFGFDITSDQSRLLRHTVRELLA